jgi:hypothetical protein
VGLMSDDQPIGHYFTFILGPEDLLTDAVINQLIELFPDALVGARYGKAQIEFDCTAMSSVEQALASKQKLECETELRVERVEWELEQTRFPKRVSRP